MPVVDCCETQEFTLSVNLSHTPIMQFLGAAGTVTGSRHLIANRNSRVLVDCGLFQGLKELRLRNWDDFPVDPATIDGIALTHAHLDHSGYVPALCRGGFKGTILASPERLRSAESCCRTVAISRKKKLITQIGKATRSTRRRVPHIPKTMRGDRSIA